MPSFENSIACSEILRVCMLVAVGVMCAECAWASQGQQENVLQFIMLIQCTQCFYTVDHAVSIKGMVCGL